jgi:hypothetical protein
VRGLAVVWTIRRVMKKRNERIIVFGSIKCGCELVVVGMYDFGRTSELRSRKEGDHGRLERAPLKRLQFELIYRGFADVKTNAHEKRDCALANMYFLDSGRSDLQ